MARRAPAGAAVLKGGAWSAALAPRNTDGALTLPRLLPVLLDAYFGILPFECLEMGPRTSLQIRIKERSDVVSRDGKAATPIKAQHAHHAHQPEHHLALEKNLVAETEVVCAQDLDSEPAINRKTIVDRLYMSEHQLDLRAGSILVAQDKHERLAQAALNDRAEWRTIEVNARLAP